jgi:hypothetical protein
MKNNSVSVLLQGIFMLVGLSLLIAGYFAAPGSLTDDGYPLNYFFYCMGGFFILWPLVLFGAIRYFYRRSARKAAYLKAQGIKGKARVTGMSRTGLTVNNVPQIILHLDVSTDLGEQFQTTYKKCIDPIYYNLIQPDRDLNVYIHPVNKKEVYVDFQEEWEIQARDS